ncbi:MAG: hypothetical protein JNM69_43375 [Archangium sp.]|nr:hypothetical protein [Archangium sp.]
MTSTASRCGARRHCDFIDAWKAPKNHWLNWAVAEDLVSRGEWSQALDAFDVAEASKAFDT